MHAYHGEGIEGATIDVPKNREGERKRRKEEP